MSKRIRPETQAQRIILLAFLSYLLNAWNRLKGLVGRSHLQGKSFQSGSIYKRSPLVRIRKGLTLVGRLDRWIPFLSFVPRGYAAALWSNNGWLSFRTCFLVTSPEPKRAGTVPLVVLYLAGERKKYPFGEDCLLRTTYTIMASFRQ